MLEISCCKDNKIYQNIPSHFFLKYAHETYDKVFETFAAVGQEIKAILR